MGRYYPLATIDPGSAWMYSTGDEPAFFVMGKSVGSGQVTLNVAPSSNVGSASGKWTTAVGEPGLAASHWNGDYVWQLEVVGAGADVTYRPLTAAVANNGETRTSVGFSTEYAVQSGVGTKTFTVSVTSSSAGTTTRYGVGIGAGNANMMAAQTLVIDLAGSWFDVPWAVGTPPTPTIPQGQFTVRDRTSVAWTGRRDSRGVFTAHSRDSTIWNGTRTSTGVFAVHVRDSVTWSGTSAAAPLPVPTGLMVVGISPTAVDVSWNEVFT